MAKNQMDSEVEKTIPVISALTVSADVEKLAQRIAIRHFTTHRINPLAAHRAHSVAPESELGHHWSFLEREIIEQAPEGSFFGLGIEPAQLNTMDPSEQTQWRELMGLSRGEGRNLWVWTEQEQAGFICVTEQFDTLVTGPTGRSNCAAYIHDIQSACVIDVNGQLEGQGVPQERPLDLQNYHFDLVVQIDEDEPVIIPLNERLEVCELGEELTGRLGADGIVGICTAINEQIQGGSSTFHFTTFTDGSWARDHGQEEGHQVANYVTATVTHRRAFQGITEDRHEQRIKSLQLQETDELAEALSHNHGCRL